MGKFDIVGYWPIIKLVADNWLERQTRRLRGRVLTVSDEENTIVIYMFHESSEEREKEF